MRETKAGDRASFEVMEGKRKRFGVSGAARRPSESMGAALVVASLLFALACTEKSDGSPRVFASTSALNTTLGISIRSISLGGMKLERTKFTAPGSSSDQDDSVGDRFWGRTTDGRDVEVRIDDRVQSLQTDVFHYEVSYSIDHGKSWKSLCGVTPSGDKIRAIPLAGVWDESQGLPNSGMHQDEADAFTFACRSSAIGACVDMGYRPWNQVTECSAAGVCKTIAGQYFHQACTRMLRADYCGDGTSHAQDAAPIDVFDGFGIQKSPAHESTFEAEWTPSGARCIGHVRAGGAAAKSVEAYVQQTCPSRLATAQRAYDCGGQNSTLHTQKGFFVPVMTRSLLANRIAGAGP